MTILANICKAMPHVNDEESGQPKKCGRINTFASLTSESDIDTSGLLKDQRYLDKGYFYSERWEGAGRPVSDLNYNYPLLALVEDRGQVKDVFEARRKPRTEIHYNLFVLDVMPGSDKCNCEGYCYDRTEEEASTDVRILLESVLQELGQFIYAQEIPPVGMPGAFSWQSERWLKTRQDQGTNNGFNWDDRMQHFIKTPDPFISIIKRAFADDLIGAFVERLTVEFHECNDLPVFDYNVDNIQQAIDGPGCC